jgi:hypothetical protein
MQPIIPGHGWHGRESSDAGWVTISSRSSLPVRRAGRCPWGFQANALCKDISVLPSTAVPERKSRCCERGVMNLSIDGHTHPAGAWPVKPPWAAASAGEEGALGCRNKPIGPMSPMPPADPRAVYKALPSSWELGLETASPTGADTIRSDEMWHTARLSFRVALVGAACRCRGRQRRKPVAAPDAADDLGLQWVFFPPVASWKRPMSLLLHGPKRGPRALAHRRTVCMAKC